MTLTNFEKSSLKEKGKVVLLEQGIFIHLLVLYNMGGFFAEVWYESNEN
jgi:hypothetical protein